VNIEIPVLRLHCTNIVDLVRQVLEPDQYLVLVCGYEHVGLIVLELSHLLELRCIGDLSVNLP